MSYLLISKEHLTAFITSGFSRD